MPARARKGPAGPGVVWTAALVMNAQQYRGSSGSGNADRRSSNRRARTGSRVEGCRIDRLLARHGFQIGGVGVDVGRVENLGRDDQLAIGRDARLVALEIGGHQLEALLGPLERLLHDGAGDLAFL